MTTLYWIKNDRIWKQYIGQRANEIRHLTLKDSWRHCPGEVNPADLPSRGLNSKELSTCNTWWNGPSFEIKRSSQLRTLLKRVVENTTWKKFRPERDLNPWPLRQLGPGQMLAQLVEPCTGIAEVMGSDSVRTWIFFKSYFQLIVSVVFLAAKIS